MGENKKIARNYFYNMSYQIISLMTPLITAPYISRVLEPEGVGKYSYTMSIVTYFITLAIFGSEGYARREIAYNQDNKDDRSQIFWEIITIRTITTIISLIIFFIIIIKTQSDFSLLIVQSINILLVVFDVTWLFQGMEEFGKIIARNFFVKIINIILIFVIIKEKNDLITYALLISSLSLIGHLSLWPYLFKFINKPGEIGLKKHFKGIIVLFIPTIAVAIYSALPKTMIGLLSNDILQNGYYEQADKIVKMLLVLITSLGTVMAPRISATASSNNIKTLSYYMKNTYEVVFLIAIPLWIGTMIISDIFVPLFFGDLYLNTIPILKVLSLTLLFTGVSTITGVQYFISTKKEKIFSYSLFIGAFVNLIFNYFLIPQYYALGASIATIVSEFIIMSVGLYYILFFEKLISLGDFFKAFSRYVVAGLIMAGILFFVKSYLGNTWKDLITLVIFGGITYMACLLLMKEKFILLVVSKIINLKRINR